MENLLQGFGAALQATIETVIITKSWVFEGNTDSVLEYS